MVEARLRLGQGASETEDGSVKTPPTLFFLLKQDGVKEDGVLGLTTVWSFTFSIQQTFINVGCVPVPMLGTVGRDRGEFHDSLSSRCSLPGAGTYRHIIIIKRKTCSEQLLNIALWTH